jgi:hypothetical protein
MPGNHPFGGLSPVLSSVDDTGMDTKEQTVNELNIAGPDEMRALLGSTPATLTHEELHERINKANFDPADVEVTGWMDTTPPAKPAFGFGIDLPADIARDMWQAMMDDWKQSFADWKDRNVELFGREFPGSKCEHCGARIRWAGIVRYIPTGQHFIVGETCADERMQLVNRREHDLRLAKMAAEHRAEQLRIATAKARFATEHPGEYDILFNEDRPYNDFFRSLRDKLVRYGDLTEKQLACVTREVEKEATAAARKVERDAENAEAGPAPEGRVQVTGTIVGLKFHHSDYTPMGGILKMTVKLENGSRVWVTVPSKVSDPTRGDKVEFTATFTRSDDDESFAFGKRPSGYTVIEEAQEA